MWGGRSILDVMTRTLETGAGCGCWRPDTDAADEDVPLLAAVALLSVMHVPADADSTRHHATKSATSHQSVVAFEEAVYSGCGLPSQESVTLLLDAVLLEAPTGLDGQTRVVGTMRILARALHQFCVLRGGGEEACVGGPALLCSSNWRLLLLASVLLASKFAEDEYAEPSTNHFSAHPKSLPRTRPHTPSRSHIELVSLHKIAALGLPVGVHPPSCDQIASAEIALLRLLEWHAGFHVGELSRQRMHLVRLAEQARLIKNVKHSPTGPTATQQPTCMCLLCVGICRWLQVVGKAEVLTPADRAFLESRHLCQDVLTSRWSNQSMWRSSARVRKQLDTELNQTDPYIGPVTRCTRTELEVGPR